MIELGVETGPAASDTASALGDGIAPDAVVKSMGVMVAGDTTVGGLDPVARALGASGGDGGGGGGSGGSNGGSNGRKTWEPVVALLRGTDRADLRAIASHFGVARRHARLATPDECVRVFGFPPGSMPPLGHRVECPTLMDSALMDSALREHAGGFVYPGAARRTWCSGASPRSSSGPPRPPRCPWRSRPSPGKPQRAAAAAAAAAASSSRDPSTASFADGGSLDWGLGAPSATSHEGSADEEHGEGTHERQRRFVADGSLGRLARWLRCLGVDAEHVPVPAQRLGNKGNNNCQYGALLALAQRDDRVILTKDRRLLQRRTRWRRFWWRTTTSKRQLARVSAHFGLRYRRGEVAHAVRQMQRSGGATVHPGGGGRQRRHPGQGEGLDE